MILYLLINLIMKIEKKIKMENNTQGLGNILEIKSPVILKKIFSNLWLTQELNIVSYNKQIQNILGIDIRNYKRLSNKYKIKEKNGKFREYIINDEINIFEGEYLTGKKISGKLYDNKGNLLLELNEGKGKEYYDNGKLQFEGDYINGKRWNGKGYNYEGYEEFEIINGKGKGTEYNYSGQLIFEGEYLNGKRNGKGKEYYKYGGLKFDGEYLNDTKYNGKEYDNYGNIILDLENGKAKEYYKYNKVKFEGQYFNGKRWNGKLYQYCSNKNFLK